MQATVWLLDVAHRARRFTCEVPEGTRALSAVEHALERQLGVRVMLPVGLRGLESAPEFLFLLPKGARDVSFMPLAEFAASDERGFSLYVDAMLGGWAPPSVPLDAFYFGDGPELAAMLAHAVINGVKRGTTTWEEAAKFDGMTMAKPGTVSIVTDGFGFALCAIRTEKIELIRFRDVTEHQAWIEGEGDRSLADWREGHRWYYGREAERIGRTFTEDSMVYFEQFELLHVFGQRA